MGGEYMYTVSEVADKLKLDVETIRIYIRAGELPAHKFGREYRIKETDYESFVDSKLKKNA